MPKPHGLKPRLTDDLLDELLDEHCGRVLGRPYASAQEQYQWESLRHVLWLTELAMEGEGVRPDVRERVLRTVVFGEPSSADVEWRTVRLAEHAAHTLYAPGPVPPELAPPT